MTIEILVSSDFYRNFANLTTFTNSRASKPGKNSRLWIRLQEMTKWTVIVGVLFFVLMYAFVTLFNIVAENQVYRLRRNYFSALLRQNVGWYDTVEDRSFVSRIAE